VESKFLSGQDAQAFIQSLNYWKHEHQLSLTLIKYM